MTESLKEVFYEGSEDGIVKTLKVMEHETNPNKRLELKLYDLEILTLLDKFKSLNVDVLHLFVEEYFSRANALSKRMNRLVEYDLVEKYRPGSFQKYDYYLTYRGCKFVNEVWHKIEHRREPAPYTFQQSEHDNFVGFVAHKVMVDNNYRYKLRELVTDRDIKLEHYQKVKKQTLDSKMFMRQLRKERRNMALPDFKIGMIAFEIELNSKGKKRTEEKIKRLHRGKYQTIWIIPKSLHQLKQVIRKNSIKDTSGNSSDVIVYVEDFMRMNFDLEKFVFEYPEQLEFKL